MLYRTNYQHVLITSIVEFILSLLIGQACQATELLVNSPCPYDGTAHRINQTLQGTLDALVEDYNLVGVSVTVLKSGKCVFEGTSGISYENKPIEPNMVFSIGSITKSFTATIIMQLQEENILSLDDTIGKWLPDIKDHLADPNYINEHITIRQLLNHTSGLGDVLLTNNQELMFNALGNLETEFSTEDILGYLGEPEFACGTRWSYSNFNFYVLSLIALEASGKESMNQLLQEKICDKIELKKTFFLIEQDIPTDCEIAHGWMDIDLYGLPGDGTLAYDDLNDLPMNSLYSIIRGSGGIVSTSYETAKFISSVFEGTLVSDESLNQMLEFVGPYGAAMGLYGINLGISGKTIWGHTGDIYGYNSAMWYEPQEEIAIVLFCNNAADEYYDYLTVTVDSILKMILEP